MSLINWPLVSLLLAVALAGVLAWFGVLPGWGNVW